MLDLARNCWRVRIPDEVGTFWPVLNSEEVPPLSFEEDDPSPSEDDMRELALYCDYYKVGCRNDCSVQLLKCSLCEVKCCSERCLRKKGEVCIHCLEAWPPADLTSDGHTEMRDSL